MRNGLTVGELKKWLEKYKVPDDAIVMLQRVEDVYFEKHHWEVKKKPSYFTYRLLEHNKKVDSGVYLDREQYPLIEENDPFLQKYTKEEIEKSCSQYYTCQSPVGYDDKDFFYLDAHI